MDEPQELTFDQIFGELLINEEIFLDAVASEDVPVIRKGLSNFKTRLNRKAAKNELPTEDRTIEFETMAVNRDNTVKLRIYFLQPKGIKAKLIPPDGSLT